MSLFAPPSFAPRALSCCSNPLKTCTEWWAYAPRPLVPPRQPALPPPSWHAPFPHLLVRTRRMPTGAVKWGGTQTAFARTLPSLTVAAPHARACPPPVVPCPLAPTPSLPRAPRSPRGGVRKLGSRNTGCTHERDGGSAAPVSPFAESGARRR
ncbi:hypothetical protein EDB86DRAFT_1096456 [Lactarius hatsudake]|nr:hypothetical protein EDB86DRAFT_1096456 [Lactarius hatsudake]